MAPEDLTFRLDVLEEKVRKLEELPGQVAALASQVLLLRTEMHDEFSAVRAEMRAEGEAWRRELQMSGEAWRQEMRKEMRELNDQTLTLMRVLHEEVIDRIGRLGEGWNR